MSEYLKPNQEYQVDPQRTLLNELNIPDDILRKLAVVGFVSTNQQLLRVAHIINSSPDMTPEERDRLLRSISNPPLHLALRTDPAIIIYDLTDSFNRNGQINFDPYLLLPYLENRIDNRKFLDKQLNESEPTDIIYDLSSMYHTSYDKLNLEFPEKILFFKNYFDNISRHLNHGGILLVQLDYPTTHTAEEINKVNTHSKAVLMGLGLAGFDTNTGQQYRYIKPDGTRGTLYLLKKEGHAQGEFDPHTRTEEGLPSGAEENAVREAQRIVEENLTVKT